MYAKKKKKPMYEMGGKAADMIMKMMKGGMMPKYPGGGMMPRKRGMMYQNGGPVDFGSDAVGEVLAGRASAANPNDMDFIRDLMVRAFNESRFGGENRGKPYRVMTEDINYEKPYFYDKDNEEALQSVINQMHSDGESSGFQGGYEGPYKVMMDALSKVEGMNKNQKSKASDLAFDMARALYR